MASRTKGKILTVRISAPLERCLLSRARERGVTSSELVRGLLEAELESGSEGPTPFESAKSLIGALDESRLPAGRDAKRELKKWRPDRRG